jgi:tetratricopeptide (TPR) repeat protein
MSIAWRITFSRSLAGPSPTAIPAMNSAPLQGVSMKSREQLMPTLVSFGVHSAVLVGMYFIKLAVAPENTSAALEAVIPDDQRSIADVTQELDTQVGAAQSINLEAGGTVSTEITSDTSSTGIAGAPGGGGGGGGGGGSGVGGTGVGAVGSRIAKDPIVRLNAGGGGGPAMETLGVDLGGNGGTGIAGEVNAKVEGYGGALDRMTKELIRMLRSEKCHVVWLFDESESMKDDQQELKGRFNRVYEELKLVEKDAQLSQEFKKRKEKVSDVLLTSIVSFGADYHVHTQQPTSDNEKIVAAIERIPVDKTGKENTCAALSKVFKQFGTNGRGRKLVVILVSDESGDDGENVETALQEAKSNKASIFVMGREAVFGSLYAHVRWIQPVTGTLHYLPIRRGPETPFAENLQWDGFRRRRDAQMSGFGPYEQVRLARDTGGIFFQLPNEETDINDLDNRKLDNLDNREYLPNIGSRREYQQERDRSPFRKAVWDVISLLNPYEERFKGMEIPDYEYFVLDWNQSSAAVIRRLQQITGMLGALGEAQKHLDAVRSLREKEPSLRWRANYDMIYAQIFAYRVRLAEFAIALEQFGKTMPQRIKDKKSNHWSIRTGAPELVFPDADQAKRLKITKEDVEGYYAKAQELLKKIIEDHPNTAWARRAEWEMGRNFGAYFNEHNFQPTPPQPNQPQPPPPPNL